MIVKLSGRKCTSSRVGTHTLGGQSGTHEDGGKHYVEYQTEDYDVDYGSAFEQPVDARSTTHSLSHRMTEQR